MEPDEIIELVKNHIQDLFNVSVQNQHLVFMAKKLLSVQIMVSHTIYLVVRKHNNKNWLPLHNIKENKNKPHTQCIKHVAYVIEHIYAE